MIRMHLTMTIITRSRDELKKLPDARVKLAKPKILPTKNDHNHATWPSCKKPTNVVRSRKQLHGNVWRPKTTQKMVAKTPKLTALSRVAI